MTKELKLSVERVREWQRHYLLREYGDDGHVLPKNIEISDDLDAIMRALEGLPETD